MLQNNNPTIKKKPKVSIQCGNVPMPSERRTVKVALVTGGAGFIGRYFCKRLIDLGFYTVCVDDMSSSNSISPEDWPDNVLCHDSNKFMFFEEDCKEFFKKENTKFNVVIHLAAMRQLLGLPDIGINNAEDVSIDAAFFKWLSVLTEKPDKVVYCSSCDAHPVTEPHISLNLNLIDLDLRHNSIPNTVMGFTEVTGEILSTLVHRKYGIDVVCYRMFCNYGDDPFVISHASAFEQLLSKVVKHENPIKINIHDVGDFVHVNDVIECILVTMNRIHDGRVIDICTGTAITTHELVKKMLKTVGYAAEIKCGECRVHDGTMRVGDPQLAMALGWKPKVSLDKGIADAAWAFQSRECFRRNSMSSECSEVGFSTG